MGLSEVGQSIQQSSQSNPFYNNGPTQSLSGQLSALNNLRATDQNFEEDLNKLRVSNAENLGRMQEEQTNKLTEAYMRRYSELVEIQKKQAQELLKEELDGKKRLNKLTEEQYQQELAQGMERIDALSAHKLQTEAKEQKAAAKAAQKAQKDKEKAESKESYDKIKNALKGKGEDGETLTWKKRKEAAKEYFEELKKPRPKYDDNGEVFGTETEDEAAERAKKGLLENALNEAKGTVLDFAKSLESDIQSIADLQTDIDTRLQGSKNKKLLGSYWDQMSLNVTGFAGASTIVSQKSIAERVSTMVSQGIAFNVEQRAALQELAGAIATTFNAADGTLLRLIRIQQQDTTAGRLGMESALTAFLNNMYETTEYMGQIADSVKSSIEEAMTMMSGEAALSFEYQVQKWLGSLYSVGVSNAAVQKISSSVGQLAAGQLEGITSDGTGNLLIMAANNAGLNISDLLNNGLNSDTTNQLLNSMVEYLAKIYNEAGNSKVLQQQYANIYGLTASDLKAVANLAPSINSIANNGLSYNSAIQQLNNMTWSAGSRISMGKKMTTLFENLQYTMAGGIANNPVMYSIYKTGQMLDMIGGIDLPFVSFMGTGVDLNTTVSELMTVAAMGGGMLTGLGTMIAGAAKGAEGMFGSGMHPLLGAMGINYNVQSVARGDGSKLITAGGASVSEAGSMIAGNSDGSDIQNKTMTDANDSSKNQIATASDESEETKLQDVNDNILSIYKLLNDIAEGAAVLHVSVDGTVSTINSGISSTL